MVSRAPWLTTGAVFVFRLAALVSMPASAAGPNVFSTWDVFEADKCASIWLIKRFIAPDAIIQFIPKGDQVTEGIPFDIPDAELRRYHNKSTFETMLIHYHLQDERLAYLGGIIHDIEVNVWEKKVMIESKQVEREIQGIISGSDRKVLIQGCLEYFDDLYGEQTE